MAATNLLTLLDDIAALMDDVALLTKEASIKTAGLMGDDLAVNSEQMIGLKASQEVPVVWKIFLGSLVNKVILIPFILILTTFLPAVMKWVLLAGGIYLCYEGAEKVFEKLFHKKEIKKEPVDPKKRIKGAVKTDFILSAEILAIASSVMMDSTLTVILISLITVSLFVSIIIYGFVLILIKLDDLGLFILSNNKEGILATFGKGLVSGSPYIMKLLGILGTIAMFMVGGGIFIHTFHIFENYNEHLVGLGVGIVVGFLSVLVIEPIKKLIQ